MQQTVTYPLQVFFDGSCSFCVANMEFYRQRDQQGRLSFVDIAAPSFEPTAYGIAFEKFMRELHAIDGSGLVFVGVDAFRVMWQALPTSSGYWLLAELIALPGVHLAARLAYWGVARFRTFLQGPHGRCRDGHCGIGS